MKVTVLRKSLIQSQPTSICKTALLHYARESLAVNRSLGAAQSIPYADKLQDPGNFKQITTGDGYAGWYQWLAPKSFAWDFRAFDDTVTISGLTLMQRLQEQVHEVVVLAIHDKPSDDSVVALHLCAGRKSGHLIGFVLERTWT